MVYVTKRQEKIIYRQLDYDDVTKFVKEAIEEKIERMLSEL